MLSMLFCDRSRTTSPVSPSRSAWSRRGWRPFLALVHFTHTFKSLNIWQTLSNVPSWLSLIRSSAMFLECRKQWARISTILLWSRFRFSSLNYKRRKYCDSVKYFDHDSLLTLCCYWITCLLFVILITTKQRQRVELLSNIPIASPAVHLHVANIGNLVALQGQHRDWGTQIGRNSVQPCPVIEHLVYTSFMIMHR